MPRRAAAQIRPVEVDPIHRSKLVQQVINKVMLDGKKSTAERIVYDALALIAERSDKDPVESLEESIRALTPSLEVRSRRVGGATYQVPVEVPARRARTLAVRWLVQFARQRPGHGRPACLPGTARSSATRRLRRRSAAPRRGSPGRSRASATRRHPRSGPRSRQCDER